MSMKKLIFFLVFSLSKMLVFAQWTPISQLKSLSSAFKAGTTVKGIPVYIARAQYDNGYLIGKVTSISNGASFAYNGKEVLLKDYDVFVGTGKWIKASANNLPKNPFQGGTDAKGNPVFIARVPIANEYCVGMFRLNDNTAWVTYNGIVQSFKEFELLALPSDVLPVTVITRPIEYVGETQVEITITGAMPNSPYNAKVTGTPQILSRSLTIQTDAEGKGTGRINYPVNRLTIAWCSLTAAQRRLTGVVTVSAATGQGQIVGIGQLTIYLLYYHRPTDSCN
jgi:Protein of unknown function (DUF3421)